MSENSRAHHNSNKGKASAHGVNTLKGKKGKALSAPVLDKKQFATEQKLLKPQLIARGNLLGNSNSNSDKPMQLQTLAPVGGATGTTTATNVWFNNGEDAVDLWTLDGGHKDDRTELLKSISEKAAALGNAIKAATNDIYTYDKANKKKAVRNARDAKDPFLPFDPVRVKISGTYGKPVQKDIELDYHYGSRWHGYIVHVVDSGKVLDHKMEAQKAEDLDATVAYSNRHEGTVNAVLAGEDSPDAATKIAGEGARWQCIRAAAGSLTDNSKIYSNDNLAGSFTERMRYVPFSLLWKTWEAAFAKKFNISDAEVVNVLKQKKIATSAGNKDVGDEHSHAITHGTDINVDTDKPASQAELTVRKASVVGFKKKATVIRSDKTLDQEKTIFENKVKGIKDLVTTDLSGGYIGDNVFIALCAFPAADTPGLGDYALVSNEEQLKYPLYKHGKAEGKMKDLAKATATWKLLAKEADVYEDERKATYETIINRLAEGLRQYSNGAHIRLLVEYAKAKVPYPALITTALPAPRVTDYLTKGVGGTTITGFVAPEGEPEKKKTRRGGKNRNKTGH